MDNDLHEQIGPLENGGYSVEKLNESEWLSVSGKERTSIILLPTSSKQIDCGKKTETADSMRTLTMAAVFFLDLKKRYQITVVAAYAPPWGRTTG